MFFFEEDVLLACCCRKHHCFDWEEGNSHRTSANRQKPSKNKYRKYFTGRNVATNGAAVVTAPFIFTKLFLLGFSVKDCSIHIQGQVMAHNPLTEWFWVKNRKSPDGQYCDDVTVPRYIATVNNIGRVGRFAILHSKSLRPRVFWHPHVPVCV
jgi:hypothetical protein